jgi:DNA-binding SARP family transcriptional activator
MEFRILGPLEVEEEGRLLNLGGAKQRSVLAFLLLHANEVVSRDRLIDELWGGEPPETASTAVQVHVSQLRKVLGRDAIVTRAPGYLIRVQDGELDLHRFEHLVDEARGQEPALAAERLREALSLWRGAPLAEIALSPTTAAERSRLEEQRLGALEQRIAADLELGRHAELVPELERLVREHPLRERLRGQLMLALYRSGRQAEALDVYRSGRRLLDEELGLEPGEELRRLERAILEQDPSLVGGRPTSAPARAAPAVPTGTVTFLFTDIEGSTKLVQRLRDDYGALLEQHHRLVRGIFEEHAGEEIDNQGDAFFFAFRRARDGVRGAVEAQKALADATWPQDASVRVRIGIHTGEPGLAETGYHGLDVVRAARISGSAHGGQILVSSATRDLVGAALEEVTFEDLGEHRLKDLEQPQRIFQVVAPGLQADFPPLRSADDIARVMTIGGREQELAAAAEAALGAEERRARFSKRSWAVAALGALLLAGAIAGLAVLLTGGSRAPVAVAPNSIAVIDPKANRVADDVPVGSRPVAVAVGEGGVWAANADDGTISRIDPKSRTVVGTIGIGTDVSDLAVGFGSVWVANGNDGTVARIDPDSNAVERTLRFGGGNELVPEPVFTVAVGAGAVWITHGNAVLRINPATNEVTKSIPVEPPLGIAVGGGSVWVTTRIDHVLRIEPRTGAITATFSLPSAAIAPVVGGGRLWLVLQFLSQQGNVWALNPDTGEATATTSGGAFPTDLAWGDGALWSAAARSVVRVGRQGQPMAKIPLGQQPTGIAVVQGAVWISVQSAT